ncbi:MAG: zinc ribbon domain-containing protein [Planctomycetota bacterium]
MKCSECGTKNPPGVFRCQKCGSALSVTFNQVKGTFSKQAERDIARDVERWLRQVLIGVAVLLVAVWAWNRWIGKVPKADAVPPVAVGDMPLASARIPFPAREHLRFPEARAARHPLFAFRNERSRYVSFFGGSRGGLYPSEQGVDEGLKWLAQAQASVGHWDPGAFDGDARRSLEATGLALLAFTGAGHGMESPVYGSVVSKAVARIRHFQNSDGELTGNMADIGGRFWTVLALLEASEIPGASEEVRGAARRAVAAIAPLVQTAFSPDKISPAPFGWAALLAAVAGRAGLDRFDPAAASLRECAGSGAARAKGVLIREDEMAALLLAHGALGLKRNEEFFKRAISVIQNRPPGWGAKDAGGDPDYIHHATLGLWAMQGESWGAWRGALTENLIAARGPGPWPVTGSEEASLGRVGSTAFAVLALEVFYRYPGLFSME